MNETKEWKRGKKNFKINIKRGGEKSRTQKIEKEKIYERKWKRQMYKERERKESWKARKARIERKEGWKARKARIERKEGRKEIKQEQRGKKAGKI